jgi:hypothetical protein
MQVVSVRVLVGVGEGMTVAIGRVGDDVSLTRVGADWTMGNWVAVGFWTTAGVVGIGVLIGDGAAVVGGRGVTIGLIGGVEVGRATVADVVEGNEGRIVWGRWAVAGGRPVATGLAVVAGLTLREYHNAAPTAARPQHKGITINKT